MLEKMHAVILKHNTWKAVSTKDNLNSSIIYNSKHHLGIIRQTIVYIWYVIYLPLNKYNNTHVVTTAGRPSGMAATARATTICLSSKKQIREKLIW